MGFRDLQQGLDFRDLSQDSRDLRQDFRDLRQGLVSRDLNLASKHLSLEDPTPLASLPSRTLDHSRHSVPSLEDNAGQMTPRRIGS